LILKVIIKREQASRNMNFPIIIMLDDVEGGIPLFRFSKLNAKGWSRISLTTSVFPLSTDGKKWNI
jgi:hypothetical protein